MGSVRTYPDGSREEIDESGWRFYRDGELVASIGDDGSAVLAGSIKTALTGCRTEIHSTGVHEVHVHGCGHRGSM